MKDFLDQATEHQIQTAISGYLRFKGFYVQRMNSGAIMATNKYGKQHMMRLTSAGTPDIMAFKEITVRATPAHLISVKRPLLLFFEVKRPGKHPTALQAEKMKELEEYGAKCFVVHSVAEVEHEVSLLT